MSQTELWPQQISIVLFITAAMVIGICGTMVTARAERLALDTGLGQAIMGAVFLGASHLTVRPDHLTTGFKSFLALVFYLGGVLLLVFSGK